MTKDIELIDYKYNAPFHIYNIVWEGGAHSPTSFAPNILEHWHPDLEIVLTLKGHAIHYIDGRPLTAHPGSVFVVNPESIHKVLSDTAAYLPGETVAIVLHIAPEFLQKAIPSIHDLYFVNDSHSVDDAALSGLLLSLAPYADGGTRHLPSKNYEYLHIVSLIYDILYRLSTKRLKAKEEVLPVNSAKNLERLRGIIQYVEQHYHEKLTQEAVAKRFYFTREYFARFFRKNTGITFTDYLTHVRATAARELLVSTDRTVLDIALDTGFSDARGLIRVFKRIYGTTPLQYRKMQCKIR